MPRPPSLFYALHADLIQLVDGDGHIHKGVFNAGGFGDASKYLAVVDLDHYFQPQLRIPIANTSS